VLFDARYQQPEETGGPGEHFLPRHHEPGQRGTGRFPVLANLETSTGERDDFIDMLSTSAQALVEEIRSQQTLFAAEKHELAVQESPCDSLCAAAGSRFRV
jgi:hypothetical protein